MEQDLCIKKILVLEDKLLKADEMIFRKSEVIRTLLEEKVGMKTKLDEEIDNGNKLRSSIKESDLKLENLKVKFNAMEKLYLGKISDQKNELASLPPFKKKTMSERIFGKVDKEISEKQVTENRIELSEEKIKIVPEKIELSESVKKTLPKVSGVVNIGKERGSNLDKRV